MNGIRGLLFKLWIWRKNRKAEEAFAKQLDQEHDTVRLNWAEVFGNDAPPQGRHHRRR